MEETKGSEGALSLKNMTSMVQNMSSLATSRGANSQKAASKPGKRSRSKAKPLPEGIKRPKSAFFIFLGQHREEYKRNHESMNNWEYAKDMGKRWNEMAKEAKEPYEAWAVQMKEKYNVDMKEYEQNKGKTNDYASGAQTSQEKDKIVFGNPNNDLQTVNPLHEITEQMANLPMIQDEYHNSSITSLYAQNEETETEKVNRKVLKSMLNDPNMSPDDLTSILDLPMSRFGEAETIDPPREGSESSAEPMALHNHIMNEYGN
jgi:hypothetical protein